MREIHYTFVLKLAQEEEDFEGAFEDGLSYVLETVEHIDGAADVDFDIDLYEKVVSP